MQGMKNEADEYIFDDEEMLRQERRVLVSQFQHFLRTELPEMQRHALGFREYACILSERNCWRRKWRDNYKLHDRAQLRCPAGRYFLVFCIMRASRLPFLISKNTSKSEHV
jgi:hypothetical protein